VNIVDSRPVQPRPVTRPAGVPPPPPPKPKPPVRPAKTRLPYALLIAGLLVILAAGVLGIVGPR